jgi:glutamine synthetase
LPKVDDLSKRKEMKMSEIKTPKYVLALIEYGQVKVAVLHFMDFPDRGQHFPVSPTDRLQDTPSEMILTLESPGIHIEARHHEAATAEQSEINMRFNSLVNMADKLLKYKYVIKKYHKTVTFMPKPLNGDNGSGMHVHISLWKDNKNFFAGDGYAGMAETALYILGSVLKHTPALLAFTCPTTNRSKRLLPGFEAPVKLAYSSRNRSASVRIPKHFPSAKAKRFQFRCPDPSCNLYLAFSAIMMAAVDGILDKTDPGLPLDKDIYDLPHEELAKVPHTPGSLGDALTTLKEDHAFLLKGEVFTQDVFIPGIRSIITIFKKLSLGILVSNNI